MNAVHDFKAIARKLNRLEQKAKFEAKNPKPEPSSIFASGTVVWTPEHGYNLPGGFVIVPADLKI